MKPRCLRFKNQFIVDQPSLLQNFHLTLTDRHSRIDTLSTENYERAVSSAKSVRSKYDIQILLWQEAPHFSRTISVGIRNNYPVGSTAREIRSADEKRK